MAGFFPIFFKQYWSTGTDIHMSTFYLGTANSIAGTVVAIMAPFLGFIADKGSAKKKFLFFFMMMGVVMTGSLSFLAKGQWTSAMMIYMFAYIGFAGGNIFYDSLIVSVAEKNRMDIVSSLGYSLGYLGGGILFALNVWMTLKPAFFGLASTGEAVRVSFVCVAIWWGVFSIPILLFVDEPNTGTGQGGIKSVLTGFQGLKASFNELRKHRVAFQFLIGYWLYIDGVDTIVLMAVDYGMSLGFDSTSLIKALLITQFVGFPAAIAFGKIGEKFGTKTGILIGISVYIVVAVWGFFMKHLFEFYVLAIVIGLVQGGVQSLSRSFFARLIPRESAGEFFGFYNMVGKFAAVLGPFLMGWTSIVTGSTRYSILSIILLFVSGGIILSLIRERSSDSLQYS
ncbi:MAG: MFS transporter [Syntrophus sp. (in: bacteria)]|nr:MFS transporter [Syntrophus sp. (in: bacteria)]